MSGPEVTIPESVVFEAWHEFRYPRAPLGGPSPALRRALKVAEQWARRELGAELARLLNIAFPDDDSDYHYGCEQLLDLVRDRAAELRGVEGGESHGH